MKIVEIIRGTSTDEGTFGKMIFGKDVCKTLELPWRDNKRQMSCVPVGDYKCVLISSPKFGAAYLLLNVPGRSEVLIHSANFGGDTSKGWDTHLHGCIAPCDRVGKILNRKGNMQMAGLVSKPAVTRLMSWLNKETFTLAIRNGE